ncbi:extracellular solute-binding protein [Bosea caraganae]|uniref:Extracellular solute-binding protein n=1 Tax=Bosea caraganae TaxID=2763117 RepID=A0A370KYM2_9HYPH|nr:extracellular solute-binding protein [Bosea caraganae]RDJ19722.1 extracellular solute-binding protein [Bosea caraganae]RDJ21397.1 extracellular solute-binding protein [Bosea caraganae]
MSAYSVSRRALLGAGAGMTAASLLGLRPAAAQQKDIRVFWWGSQERADRTNRAVDAFKKANSGIDAKTEFAGWSDYWPRLATRVAGRNAPDLIQMDYRYMFEYARRGAIVPLDQYLGSALKIEGFDKANLESCSVDGKLFGINLGVNSSCAVYDTAAWEAAGVEPLTFGTSWDEFSAKCAAFAKGNKRRRFYATMDASGHEPAFELWLVQHGKVLYTEAGQLGFDEKDAAGWFKLWADMRKSGGCVPADVQALDKSTLDTSTLTLGYAATAFPHSNQFVGLQQLNKAKLAITAVPVTAGGKPGQYLKPSQMWSVTSDSKSPDIAVKLANYSVVDPEGSKILGVERGVPASAAVRDLLSPTLDEVSRSVVDYIGKLGPYTAKLPPSPPKGAGEVFTVLERVSQEVGFGVSPEEGGKKFVTEAVSILKRG